MAKHMIKNVTITTVLSYVYEDDEPEPTVQDVLEFAAEEKFGDYMVCVGDVEVKEAE